MKEFDFIDGISTRTEKPRDVLVGIGDDAAVLVRDAYDLVTVDTMVEGVHFRLDWSSAAQVGWKLMSSNLSDIAAMGGRPGAYFLALSIGPNVDQPWTNALFDGLEIAADELSNSGVRAAGGDTTRSPGPTVLTLTLLGSSAPSGAVGRSGARPGDLVFLVGEVGLAASGLEVLERIDAGEELDRGQWRKLIAAHQQPLCQTQAGIAIGDAGLASAMIDISDGLLQDLGHIAKASGVGARISLDKIPVEPLMMRLCASLMQTPWDWILNGGDDYSLLVVVSPAVADEFAQLSARTGFTATPIGKITQGSDILVIGPDGLPTQWKSGPCYEHQIGKVQDDG